MNTSDFENKFGMLVDSTGPLYPNKENWLADVADPRYSTNAGGFRQLVDQKLERSIQAGTINPNKGAPHGAAYVRTVVDEKTGEVRAITAPTATQLQFDRAALLEKSRGGTDTRQPGEAKVVNTGSSLRVSVRTD
jgi:hypothetical protein